MPSPFKMRETDTHVYFLTGPGSQWYPSVFEQQILPDGPMLKFNCAEQAMMALKAYYFGDVATADKIMAVQPKDMKAILHLLKTNPAEALRQFNPVADAQKKLGREVKPYDDAKWRAAAPDLVFHANIAKFSQNEDLRQWLLGTGDKILVEGSGKDRIWGVGIDYADDRILDEANWLGGNDLGKVLMRVRAWLFRHKDLFDLYRDPDLRMTA